MQETPSNMDERISKLSENEGANDIRKKALNILEFSQAPRSKKTETDCLMDFFETSKVLNDNLSPAELTSLASHVVFRKYPADTLLFLQGRIGSEYYLLLEGCVNCLSTNTLYDDSSVMVREAQIKEKHGEELQRMLGKSVAVIENEGSFGEWSLLTGGKHMMSAICQTAVRLAIVNESLYREIFLSKHQQRFNIGKKAELLNSISAISAWGMSLKRQVAYCLKEVQFSPRVVIGSTGDQLDFLFIIFSGSVAISEKIQKKKSKGSHKAGEESFGVEVCVARRGSILGDIEVLGGSKVFAYTYTAVDAVVLFRLTVSYFKMFFMDQRFEHGRLITQSLQESAKVRQAYYSNKVQEWIDNKYNKKGQKVTVDCFQSVSAKLKFDTPTLKGSPTFPPSTFHSNRPRTPSAVTDGNGNARQNQLKKFDFERETEIEELEIQQEYDRARAVKKMQGGSVRQDGPGISALSSAPLISRAARERRYLSLSTAMNSSATPIHKSLTPATSRKFFDDEPAGSTACRKHASEIVFDEIVHPKEIYDSFKEDPVKTARSLSRRLHGDEERTNNRRSITGKEDRQNRSSSGSSEGKTIGSLEKNTGGVPTDWTKQGLRALEDDSDAEENGKENKDNHRSQSMGTSRTADKEKIRPSYINTAQMNKIYVDAGTESRRQRAKSEVHTAHNRNHEADPPHNSIFQDACLSSRGNSQPLNSVSLPLLGSSSSPKQPEQRILATARSKSQAGDFAHLTSRVTEKQNTPVPRPAPFLVASNKSKTSVGFEYKAPAAHGDRPALVMAPTHADTKPADSRSSGQFLTGDWAQCASLEDFTHRPCLPAEETVDNVLIVTEQHLQLPSKKKQSSDITHRSLLLSDGTQSFTEEPGTRADAPASTARNSRVGRQGSIRLSSFEHESPIFSPINASASTSRRSSKLRSCSPVRERTFSNLLNTEVKSSQTYQNIENQDGGLPNSRGSTSLLHPQKTGNNLKLSVGPEITALDIGAALIIKTVKDFEPASEDQTAASDGGLASTGQMSYRMPSSRSSETQHRRGRLTSRQPSFRMPSSCEDDHEPLASYGQFTARQQSFGKLSSREGSPDPIGKIHTPVRQQSFRAPTTARVDGQDHTRDYICISTSISKVARSRGNSEAGPVEENKEGAALKSGRHERSRSSKSPPPTAENEGIGLNSKIPWKTTHNSKANKSSDEAYAHPTSSSPENEGISLNGTIPWKTSHNSKANKSSDEANAQPTSSSPAPETARRPPLTPKTSKFQQPFTHKSHEVHANPTQEPVSFEEEGRTSLFIIKIKSKGVTHEVPFYEGDTALAKAYLFIVKCGLQHDEKYDIYLDALKKEIEAQHEEYMQHCCGTGKQSKHHKNGASQQIEALKDEKARHLEMKFKVINQGAGSINLRPHVPEDKINIPNGVQT